MEVKFVIAVSVIAFVSFLAILSGFAIGRLRPHYQGRYLLTSGVMGLTSVIAQYWVAGDISHFNAYSNVICFLLAGLSAEVTSYVTVKRNRTDKK